jgi:hypothetical protein
MNLRQVAIFALALLAAPAPSPGQQPAKVYRIPDPRLSGQRL